MDMKRSLAYIFQLTLCFSGFADEGMWLFNRLPIENIQGKYGVQLDPEWIEHVQKSCLRVSTGGSGSFVSARGLVMTNHHVGERAIYQLSTSERDLMELGFYAQNPSEELKCPNLYVDQLISIQDVTKEVNQGLSDEMSSIDKEKMRKTRMHEIKKDAKETTGLQPEVVSLYQGAEYHLYLYKRYTDVRLVMAPDKYIASLGGEIDNFEYPRYALDVCFFRVYENNQPLATEHYLKWNLSGPQASEALFVVGNPGHTKRIFTSPHLQFVKEVELPLLLKWMREKRDALLSFGKTSQENRRIATHDILKLQNSLKALSGVHRDFTKLSIIQKKREFETSLYGDPEKCLPWVKLRAALEHAKDYYPAYWVLEGGGAYYSKLYMWAKHLVRLSTERPKHHTTRLKEYADTELPSLELDLFSTEPIYLGLERLLLASSLTRMAKILGENHPAVKAALAGKSPEKRAEELIDHSRLHDLAMRKKLYEHLQEIEQSKDPLILLATALDPFAREVRKKKEDELDSTQNESYTEITKLILNRYGTSIYPDGTFTLRLSVGELKGYEDHGTELRPITTIGDMFDHAKSHRYIEPYSLTSQWREREPTMKKDAPFNFISTNDIIGGNSGSPVINSQGEVVGLIFDGNVHSLIWNHEYTSVQGRAISVHAQGILEALRAVYGAGALVKEILCGDE